MLDYYKSKVLNRMQDSIKMGYNLNHEEVCEYVFLDYTYFPDKYDGSNPPKISFVMKMRSGKDKTENDCSKPFTELMNHFLKNYYELYLKRSA